MAELPKNISDREFDKFAENSDGNTSVRVIVTNPKPADAAGPSNLQLANNEIEEGLPSQTDIGTLSIDGGIAPIVYTIIQDIANAFQLNGNILETSRALDFSSEPILNVAIRATDNNGKFVDNNFTVNVLEAGGFVNAKSYEFNGNSFIVVPSNDYVANDNTSWFAWMKANKPSVSSNIFNSQSGSNNAGVKLVALTGVYDLRLSVIKLNGNQKRYNYEQPQIYDGNWHLIGFVIGSDSIELWIDGQFKLPTNIALDQNVIDIGNNTTEAYIGVNENGTDEFFVGLLDEIGYVNDTLEIADWLTIYNNGIPTDVSSLVDHWYRADGDTLPTITDNKGTLNAIASNVALSTDTLSVFSNNFSVEFDGISNYFIGNGAPDFTLAKTFSFWIKRTTLISTDILYGNRALVSTDNGFSIYFDNNTANRLYFEMESTGGLDQRARWELGSSTMGNWTHVAITMGANLSGFDVNGMECYVNGTLVTRANQDNDLVSIPTLSNTIAFGAGTTGGSNIGALFDEFAVIDRELNQTEIDELYNGGIPTNLSLASFSDDLFQWFRFGDLNDLSAVVTDVVNNNQVVMINYDAAFYSGDVP